MSARRVSGLQRIVLNLYRDALRAASGLPAGASRARALAFTRAEFRRGAAAVDRLDVARIELMCRQARKTIKRASAPNVTGFDFAAAGPLR